MARRTSWCSGRRLKLSRDLLDRATGPPSRTLSPARCTPSAGQAGPWVARREALHGGTALCSTPQGRRYSGKNWPLFAPAGYRPAGHRRQVNCLFQTGGSTRGVRTTPASDIRRLIASLVSAHSAGEIGPADVSSDWGVKGDVESIAGDCVRRVRQRNSVRGAGLEPLGGAVPAAVRARAGRDRGC